MDHRQERLKELGIELPSVSPPLGSYVPARISGNYIYVSGQLPLQEGKLMVTGKVGDEVSVEDASRAARMDAVKAIADIKNQIGDLSKVQKIVKITGYVASAPGFYNQANVLNGASDLFFEVFGEEGKHARAAVGVAGLPMNSPVEVAVLAELTP